MVHTANIFNRITCQQKKERGDDNNKQKVLYYISTGVRKKDRINIIEQLAISKPQQEKQPCNKSIV
jgi:hypothetical protein